MNIDVTKSMPYKAGGKDWDLTAKEVDLAKWAANDIRIRLTTFKGQYMFDVNAGIDWFRYLDKGIDLREVREGIRVCIQGCPVVTRLDSIETTYDPTTRRLSVTFSARLSDGSKIEQSETVI